MVTRNFSAEYLVICRHIKIIMHAFWAKRWTDFCLQPAGDVRPPAPRLATHPELGAIALTLVIAVSFVVHGAFRIGAALSARIDGWDGLLVNEIVAICSG